MCGIAGIIGKAVDEQLLNKMLDRINHRGEQSYQHENKIFSHAAIGMNRLAIVDENHGAQPFTNNAGVYCVFNGEIYNCAQIKEELTSHCTFNTSCDTEVVLQSYVYWGENFASKLDGKFAICIIDLNKNISILARDHIGIKPLYYAEHNESIFFSSEKKSFCAVPAVEKISALAPGSIMVNSLVKKYYAVPELSTSLHEEATLEGVRSRLIEAVKKRIPTESKKIACLLSGGLDSSIVLYLASQLHGHNNVEAFTFANTTQPSGDLEAASKLCSELNIKHIVVSPSDEELMNFYLQTGVYLTESYEPVLVRNAVSYHYVCKKVREKGYKFVLNGEGADEIFGGYAFFKEIEPEKRDEEIRKTLIDIHKTYLHMADRASMFATIEARVPYMDKEFINYSMRFPSHFRINGTQDKWALRQIFKNELPAYITQRAKTGMNEGAGFGRNLPTEGIYYRAVKGFYDSNPERKIRDIEVCNQYAPLFKIHMDYLEEIYNFARYVEYGYVKYDLAYQRIQLNTPLLKSM